MSTPSTASQPTGLTIPVPTLDTKEDRDKDKHLKNLVTALKKHKDSLPEDVQQLIQEVNSKSGQQETKQLHAAVSQHGRAKKELQEAQAARHHMHSAWRNFLSQSVDQWNAYTQKFMEQEKQLTERVQQAKELLAQAKINLTGCQSAAGGETKSDVMELSEAEDTENKDSDMSAGKRIADSLQELNANLTTLHSQANQAVEKEAAEQDKKRPRIESTVPPPEPVESAKPFGEAE